MSARDVIANTFGVKEVFGHRENEPCALCFDTADTILSALDAAGYAVVPKFPSLAMCWAGEMVPDTRLTSEVYKEMLKAAKETP